MTPDGRGDCIPDPLACTIGTWACIENALHECVEGRFQLRQACDGVGEICSTLGGTPVCRRQICEPGAAGHSCIDNTPTQCNDSGDGWRAARSGSCGRHPEFRVCRRGQCRPEAWHVGADPSWTSARRLLPSHFSNAITVHRRRYLHGYDVMLRSADSTQRELEVTWKLSAAQDSKLARRDLRRLKQSIIVPPGEAIWVGTPTKFEPVELFPGRYALSVHFNPLDDRGYAGLYIAADTTVVDFPYHDNGHRVLQCDIHNLERTGVVGCGLALDSSLDSDAPRIGALRMRVYTSSKPEVTPQR